jgi:hypothetical protein
MALRQHGVTPAAATLAGIARHPGLVLLAWIDLKVGERAIVGLAGTAARRPIPAGRGEHGSTRSGR